MMGRKLRGRVATRMMIWRRQPKPQRPQQALQQHAPLPASGFDQGGRERERETETERQRQRDRETERQRQRNERGERQRQRQMERQRHGKRETNRERRVENATVVCDGDGS